MKREGPRRWVVPSLLMACIVLGGSAQGIWINAALQIAAVAVLAWAWTSRRSDELTRGSRLLLALLAGIAILVALQLIPLPPALWTTLPGRQFVSDGFQALGYALPAMPVSLASYEGVATALAALPAIAVLIATLRIRQRESWIAAVVVAAAFAAIFVGALQVATGGPGQSPWYFHPITNRGAVGFFANVNHMGSLLLVAIPFAVAVFASFASRSGARSPRGGNIAMGASALIVIATGIALNGSLAAVGLAVPVLLFSLLLLPMTGAVRRPALAIGALLLVGAILLLTGSPIDAEAAGDGLSAVAARSDIWASSVESIRQTFPVGTGLGSFKSVYPLTETATEVRRTYVNHAHNDYLEILLELGIGGALILLLLLGWWAAKVVTIWRSALSTHYARAATIASGALLAHSLVDYPLRTVALSAIFAACLGLMAQPRRERRKSDDPRARPTKHVIIG